MKLQDIRASFIEFFANNDHEVVKTSSLVPDNDPTLLFANSGMVQFKDIFTGNETRDYKRAVTVQRCLRAGGKHNDLENVGYTARHHTFFEMLGNFSFGDYFKEEAIVYAWDFLTKQLGIPKDKLLCTVYHEDTQAMQLWKKVAGFSDDKIIKISTNDNFWSMGDTGPCGPSTELFYDHGAHIAGGPPGSPDEDGDRFIEIWNLVFMQYEQLSADKRINLPKPSIDTGMGLERISAILQNVHSNYQVDLFQNITKAIEDIFGVKSNAQNINSFYVIGDHLRALCFMIADGILPSNEGRGYVLRRIMRRGMRHANHLAPKQVLMWKLAPVLIQEMGGAYPELIRAQTIITQTLRSEEERFQQTLDRGLNLLDEHIMKLASGEMLEGKVAFTLYDTYGFPVDLTGDILRGKGLQLDQSGFDKCMEAQKEQSRKAWAGSGDAGNSKIWHNISQEHGGSDFIGYSHNGCQAVLQSIVVEQNNEYTCVTEITGQKNDTKAILIFNQTPFYGVSGGQEGDHGIIYDCDKVDGQKITVVDCTKPLNNLIAHHVVIPSGVELKVGQNYGLSIDETRRGDLRVHHSATHLLHAALRHVLGDGVTQKGSLVTCDKLRFDFSHEGPIAVEQLQQIETIVNKVILANNAVTTQIMNVDDAIKEGAMALFGEKYTQDVRVLSMGLQNIIDDKAADKDVFSVELCGGTHVSNTGDIGSLYITAESAVAAGIRRIEAVAGTASYRHMIEQRSHFQAMAQMAKTSTAQLPEKLTQIIANNKKLEKDLQNAKKSDGSGENKIININNKVQIDLNIILNLDSKAMKSIVDQKKKNLTSGIIVLLSANDDTKSSVVVGVTNDLTNDYDAGNIVRHLTVAMDGKGGGGRADMAQGGGKKLLDMQQLSTCIKEIIA